MARVQVRLAQNEVRRLAVGGRDRVPDKDAAVLGVGDEQPAAVQPDTLRPPHPARGGLGESPGEIGLAKHDIRIEAIHGGDRVPEKHPVVVGVGHGKPDAVTVHSRRVVEPRRVRQVGRACGLEVRLPEHCVGNAHARRTRLVLREESVRPGNECGDVLVDEDAVVDGQGAEAVAIRDEEAVAGVRHTLRGAEHLAAGDRVLPCKALLADYEPGTLVRHPDRFVVIVRPHVLDRRQHARRQRNESIESHLGFFRRPSPALRRPSSTCR